VIGELQVLQVFNHDGTGESHLPFTIHDLLFTLKEHVADLVFGPTLACGPLWLWQVSMLDGTGRTDT
jgi:hypothetical protein